VNVEAKRSETLAEAMYEQWVHWPVNWSAIWTGALGAVAAVLIFGLIGVAVGAHVLDPAHRVVDLKKIGLGTLAFSVFGSFLAFVIGGWIAGKIAGILRAEPGMLHGAIVWLTAVPLLVHWRGWVRVHRWAPGTLVYRHRPPGPGRHPLIVPKRPLQVPPKKREPNIGLTWPSIGAR